MRCADDVLAQGLEGALGRGAPRALEVWAASKGAGLAGVGFWRTFQDSPVQEPGARGAWARAWKGSQLLKGPKGMWGYLSLGWGGSGNVRGREGCSG